MDWGDVPFPSDLYRDEKRRHPHRCAADDQGRDAAPFRDARPAAEARRLLRHLQRLLRDRRRDRPRDAAERRHGRRPATRWCWPTSTPASPERGTALPPARRVERRAPPARASAGARHRAAPQPALRGRADDGRSRGRRLAARSERALPSGAKPARLGRRGDRARARRAGSGARRARADRHRPQSNRRRSRRSPPRTSPPTSWQRAAAVQGGPPLEVSIDRRRRGEEIDELLGIPERGPTRNRRPARAGCGGHALDRARRDRRRHHRILRRAAHSERQPARRSARRCATRTARSSPVRASACRSS